MGILKKYEYRSTWMRYADLPAETGALADWSTTRQIPAWWKEQPEPPKAGK